MTRLADMRCLFVDAQTTGPTPATGGLLELGWCVAAAADDGAACLASLEGALVRPAGEVPSRILKLTGRTAAELEAGAALADVYQRLQRAVATHRPAVLVAHYARFEAPFLAHLWQECGGEPLPLPLLCTHDISRRLFPDLPSRSIRAVAGYFGLGMEPLKHATAHAHATAHIWRHLCRALEEREGVTTLGELAAWTARKAPGRSGARAWPLERERRLGLPDVPGIYRMLAADGRILYVGKATSLRSRVNSYFRQRKGHPPAKLELLTQVVDVETVPCLTALEAALLETDEIKRHDPPYNVALKQGRRTLGFYDDLLAPAAGEGWRYGPFPRAGELTPLWLLAAALGAGGEAGAELLAPLLYGETPPEVVAAGIACFAAAAGVAKETAPRGLLARGIRLARAAAAAGELEEEGGEDDESDGDAGDSGLAAAGASLGSAGVGSAGEATADAGGTALSVAAAALGLPTADDDGPVAATAESVAGHLLEILTQSGRAYLRAREVRRLLNADVTWREPGASEWRRLVVRGGVIRAAGAASEPTEALAVAPALPPAERLDISTYDRMRVLATELARVVRDGHDAAVRYLGPQGNSWH